MKKLVLFIFISVISISVCIYAQQKRQQISDKDIKQILIQGSITSYSGYCLCNYNYDCADRRCGARSA